MFNVDGSLFFEGENQLNDATNILNNLKSNFSSCSSFNVVDGDYLSNVKEAEAIFLSLLTDLQGSIEKVISTKNMLSNMDSTFLSDYTSAYQKYKFVDENLEILEDGNYLVNIDAESEKKLYDYLLDLEKKGLLDDNLKKTYVLSKFGDKIPNEYINYDFQLINVLFLNPDLEYKGISEQVDGNVSYNAYCFNSKNNREIYIDTYSSCSYDMGILVSDINNMPPELVKSSQKIRITDKECPYNDYYRNLDGYDDSYSCPANGGDDFINIYSAPLLVNSSTMSQSYEQSGKNVDRNKYYDQYIDDYYENYVIGLIYHESAHTYDNINNKYVTSDDPSWAEAVKNDGGQYITDYALCGAQSYPEGNGKYCEDYAESVRLLYELGASEFENKYPNRAKLLRTDFPSMFN